MCNCAGGCSTMLYCTVTGQLLETSVEAVKRHMSGKKYLRNKGKGLGVVLDGQLACTRQQRLGWLCCAISSAASDARVCMVLLCGSLSD